VHRVLAAGTVQRRRRTGRLALMTGAVAVAVLLAGGIALRVWIYRSILGIPNSDESIVGLMVLHAMHGNLTTFYWGSPYAGPQEVLLSVPVFAVAGVNYLALRVVPNVLSLLAAIVVWRVGRRMMSEPAAVAAAALIWVWPPFNLFQNTQHQSFYAANVLYCGLLLLLALRAAEDATASRVGWLGFTIGFGFWETPQLVPIAAPVVAWTIWREARCLRYAWLGALLAALGAAPWIVWNARNGWASLGVHGTLGDYEHSLRLLVSPILPMTLGLRAPFSQTPILPSTAAVYAIYAGLVALFAIGAVRARRNEASLLYFVAAVFPFVYAIGRRTAGLSGWPQYTVIVTPVIALLLAQVATRWWRAAILVALAGTVTAVSVPRMESWFREPQPVPRAPRSMQPLIAALDRLHLDRVYADYWIAYRLDFATQERILAVENEFTRATYRNGEATPPPDPTVRYRPYEREVAAAPVHGFVFFKRTYRTLPIVPGLERHGYRKVPVGPFVVFAPVGAS
jgi:4-amino-4-deoxy-L-arabinose transferase-like glycosyltransferase